MSSSSSPSPSSESKSPSSSSSSPSTKISIFSPSNGMQYVRLGKSGLQVSRIVLGMMSYGTPTWQPWILSEEEGEKFIVSALQKGINFFDTADVYSCGVSEEILGKSIAKYMKRDEVVIASKCYFSVNADRSSMYKSHLEQSPNSLGLSRKHIFDACDASLKRLGVSYIDLYQIHRFDRFTPIEETMKALHDLVTMGKVRYIGASSMYCYQFVMMQAVAERNGWTKFITMQNHYNLVYREEEREMIPYCKETGVGLLPWSPLARGFLCGNRKQNDKDGKNAESTLRTQTDKFQQSMYFSDDDMVIAQRVEELSKKRGIPAAQLSLAWILTKVDAPIIGATKMSHLDDACEALKVKLSEEDIKFLEEKYKPHEVLGGLK